MPPKLDTKSVMGIFAVLIVGLVLSPTLISLVKSAQPYDYTTYQTLNSGFTDNDDENCPAYWDNVVTVNRLANWSQPDERVWDNGDDGTSSWYQSVAVASLSDGVSSATIKAKFRLYENTGLTDFVAWVYLDNSTDNILIWESTSIENTLTYISIENSVSDNITAAGTYCIHIGENVTTAANENIITYWDDASLTVVTQTKTHTSMMIFAYLIPLFFVIGMVLLVIYWATSRS